MKSALKKLDPYESDLARWYPLKEHSVQSALVTDNVRFKVVPAGRRSGKTEKAKRFVVKEAMRVPGPYFVAAPTRDQVKRIYWNDLKKLSFCSILPDAPSESELIIKFPNGSTISLIGLDQPQRMEGVLWIGGIIDEIADTKENAWQENVSPALDTFDPMNPEYRAWCWLIGVPVGLNHYYDMAEYARTANDPDWKLYTWPSADILPEDTIEAAKRRMSARQFRQEYEASFETAAGRIYEDYSSAFNATLEELQSHEQIMWCHDFNYTPMSSAICTRRKDSLFIMDEIILVSAIARQTAMEFVERFKNHGNKNVIIYGDPAGRAGEKHAHASDYTEIEDVLRANDWTVTRKVKNAAPAIRDRQNAVRAKIANAAGHRTLYVNIMKCPYVHKGLSTVQIKKGSTFLEEETEYQHITTAIGYLVDYEWPITAKKEEIKVEPIGSANHYNRNR